MTGVHTAQGDIGCGHVVIAATERLLSMLGIELPMLLRPGAKRQLASGSRDWPSRVVCGGDAFRRNTCGADRCSCGSSSSALTTFSAFDPFQTRSFLWMKEGPHVGAAPEKHLQKIFRKDSTLNPF